MVGNNPKIIYCRDKNEASKEALERMFQKQDPKKFPAAFYAKPSAEVIVLTDIE